MAKKAFYSFHYKPDNWRAAQVRNIGAIEGNAPASDNTWESITNQGDAAIKRWIASQMQGRPCTIVLIGRNTAGRKWINYEIEKAWNDGKGVVGIYVHKLKNRLGNQATKGSNPFSSFTVGSQKLSSIVKAYDPPGASSTSAYNHIAANLESWVDEAIAIRKQY